LPRSGFQMSWSANSAGNCPMILLTHRRPSQGDAAPPGGLSTRWIESAGWRSRLACCAVNVWTDASPPKGNSYPKSRLGNDSAMPHAPASNGCSQPRKPAPKSAAPTPSHSSLPDPTPKSHNHCAAVLVPRHSDFDQLIWDQRRTGRVFGSTSISMLRATPGCLRMKPARSSVSTIW
jgi:hypothetical protein